MSRLLTSPRLLSALCALAHKEAEALRREALDDFWRGGNALLQDGGAQALRSAQRLSYRLQRRAAALAA